MGPIFNETQLETIHNAFHEGLARTVDLLSAIKEKREKGDALEVGDPMAEILKATGICFLRIAMVCHAFGDTVNHSDAYLVSGIMFGICLHKDMPEILDRISSGMTDKDIRDSSFSSFMESMMKEQHEPEATKAKARKPRRKGK